MKQISIILSLILSSAVIAQGISLDWAGAIGGSSNDYGMSIAIDDNGNVFTTGYFQSTADFDPGSGTTNLSSAGQYDVYVTKFNPQGDLVWAKRMGGNLNDKGLGIAVDINGNVYTTGTFSGTADFNPGSGVFNLNSSGGEDVFVSKLDNNGNFMWAGRFSGTSNNYGADIAVDDNENIYLTGYFNGSVDFDPAPGTYNLSTSGAREIFVAKLDITYNLVWAKKMGGNQSDEARAIALDDIGNVYTTGTFSGSPDFDPGSGTFTLTSVNSSFHDIFVSKLDNNGNFVWAKHLGGNSDEVTDDISVDANGNVYTTGRFDGTVDFDPGTGTSNLTTAGHYDIFVSKLDVSGNYLWAKSIGGANWDEGYSIITDNNNDVYLTGYFGGNDIDFNPGTGVFEMSATGISSAFNLKLNDVGDFQWANQIDGTGDSYGIAITVGAPDNIYTTGYFNGSNDFDPGSGTLTLNYVSGYDKYIQKLQPCTSTSGTDVQTACDTYTWIDGNTYTSSNNTATHILANAAGCDSVVTLDLTITNSTSGTDIQTACDSYTWIDGNTYTSTNNTATHTLTNAAGCDSVVTLDLTITNSTSGTDIQTACDTYTWIDGNTYTSSNNTATHVLTNSVGCDSVVTLDLTINSSTSSTDVINTCDNQYTWIDGVTYTANNNTAIHTISNVAGCDSVITLDLTFNSATSGTDIQTACDSYTWIDGNTYTSSNNTATHTLTNAAGCDSVVTLDLTITNSTSGTDVQTACESFTWIDGNTYTTSNNTATYVLTNAVGCDSVVTLDLTLTDIDNAVNTNGTTITANLSGASYQWLDCDNGYAPISGETSQSYTAASNGNYAVEVSQNGCADTSDCVAITTVGLDDLKNTYGVHVYPNPASDIINIQSSQKIETVRLLNINGELIKQTKEKNIAVGELNAGVYLVQVTTLNGVIIKKIVKR